jgi:hypothetical protein
MGSGLFSRTMAGAQWLHTMWNDGAQMHHVCNMRVQWFHTYNVMAQVPMAPFGCGALSEEFWWRGSRSEKTLSCDVGGSPNANSCLGVVDVVR